MIVCNVLIRETSHARTPFCLLGTGLPFENGIALTRKNVGENEWDWDA